MTKPAAVTYSKATQTSSMSTSTSDIELDYDEERDNRRKADGGIGRETEDEMRKRILDEMDEERKVLEQELRELKAKVEIRALPGKPFIRGEVDVRSFE